MSGSTIGGFAGAAIGFWFGGPEGARWGFMAGSMIGGAVDPDVIQGPRLTDAQTQTSNEGVPRPIIYGTACVAGNIIQVGPLVEHKTSQRAGKGGPVQESYTYTRDVAIRICEAAPLGGTMRLRRAWKNDKLVYDASGSGAIDAESASFSSILTFYAGDEDQLPDPTLEALPAANGGGVGNVPAYRGSCYVVLTGLDVTETGGAVPQFRWEVCSDATSETGSLPTIGAETVTAAMSGQSPPAYIGYGGVGVTFMSATEEALSPGETYTVGSYNGDLEIASSEVIEYVNPYPLPSDLRWQPIASKGSWAVGVHSNYGLCELLQGGERAALLVPTEAQIDVGWWGAEGSYYPEYGGLCWFTSGSVYLGVRTAGSGTKYNTIYKWPLQNIGNDWQVATSISPVVTAGTHFYMHMDRVETVRAIALAEAELITYDADLSEMSRESLPMSFSGIRAFAVDGELLILFRESALYFYDLDTFTLQQTVGLSGVFSGNNNQVICTDDSIFIRSGVNLKRVAFAPSCYAGVPEGWYALPDTPAYVTNGTIMMPLCSAPQTLITPGMVALDDIIADIASRVGVDSATTELSPLAAIQVRGFPVARQTSAAEAVRSLQQVYFFDLPEWGNSGDTGTKLRAVLRGGALAGSITDDDLVDTGDDEDIRGQQVEFPRKVNLTASDPESNYEPITQSAERSTENVKAVGEASFSTNVVMTRDEDAAVADKMLKVLWEQALGRTTIELPEEFTRFTPSDRIAYGGKLWRIDEAELLDGTVRWDMTRDRASAYGSDATGSTALPPTAPASSTRGPSIFAAMNLPSLRSADNVPGLYLSAQGLLPGWVGADIYLSTDGGVSEQKVATITDPATMGKLAAGAGTTGTIKVDILPGGELDSITDDQVAARMNGFAVITAGVAEVGQFKTATEDPLIARRYDLTDVSRGQLGTIAAGHLAGDRFVLLDGSVKFLPLDVEHAGKTLIFRAVSIGTAPANNPTTSVVFDPPTFIIDGGGA